MTYRKHHKCKTVDQVKIVRSQGFGDDSGALNLSNQEIDDTTSENRGPQGKDQIGMESEKVNILDLR